MAKQIYVQDPTKYIPTLAQALKNLPEFESPEWMAYVKSGTSRKRPPIDDDFWYIRSASILRQLYLRGVVGVGKLRTRYGSRKDRGGRPEKFKKASGKIIRVILQQAEAAGLVEKMEKMQHGRRLTAKGRDFLDSITVEAPAGLDLDSVIVHVEDFVQEDFEDEDEVEENSDDVENVESEEVESEDEKTVDSEDEAEVKKGSDDVEIVEAKEVESEDEKTVDSKLKTVNSEEEAEDGK